MLDRKNKGGKSLVLRCISAVKYDSRCPFYAKLRRSTKDDMWYICAGLEMVHNCPEVTASLNHAYVNAMMALRAMDDTPNVEALDGRNFGDSDLRSTRTITSSEEDERRFIENTSDSI